MENERRFLKALEEEKRKTKINLIFISLATTIFFILLLIFFKVFKVVVLNNQIAADIIICIIGAIIIGIFIILIISLIGSILFYNDTKNCLEALKQIINLLPIGKVTSVYLREDISNITGKILHNICDDKKINITLLEEEKTNNIVLSIEVEGCQNISNTIKYNESRDVEELERFISLIDWKKTKNKGD